MFVDVNIILHCIAYNSGSLLNC